MKKIEAIIPPIKVGKVCIALEEVGHPGPVISHMPCQRGLKGVRYQLRGKAYNVDLLARMRVEVIVKDGEAEEIMKTIRDAAYAGGADDCKIFVYAMEEATV